MPVRHRPSLEAKEEKENIVSNMCPIVWTRDVEPPSTATCVLHMYICTHPERNAHEVAKASRQTKYFSTRATSLHIVDIPSISGRSPVLERLKIALDSPCAHIGFSLCCTNESQEIRNNEAVTHPKSSQRGRDHQYTYRFPLALDTCHTA